MNHFSVEHIQSPISYAKFCSAFQKENGLDVLGKGVYSRVVGEDGAKDCYKIGPLFANSKWEDPYWNFLKMVDKQPNNPFFPKIYGITIFKSPKKDEPDWYVVRMERLTALPSSILDIGSQQSKKSRFARMALSILLEADRAKLKAIDSFLKDVAPQSEIGLEFYQAVNSISKNFKRFEEDLHKGNIMLRGQQVVITDPFGCSRYIRNLWEPEEEKSPKKRKPK